MSLSEVIDHRLAELQADADSLKTELYGNGGRDGIKIELDRLRQAVGRHTKIVTVIAALLASLLVNDLFHRSRPGTPTTAELKGSIDQVLAEIRRPREEGQ